MPEPTVWTGQPHIDKALDLAERYGGIDSAHHKQWVIDQMVRALLEFPTAYKEWVDEYNAYDADDWSEGVAP